MSQAPRARVVRAHIRPLPGPVLGKPVIPPLSVTVFFDDGTGKRLFDLARDELPPRQAALIGRTAEEIVSERRQKGRAGDRA